MLSPSSTLKELPVATQKLEEQRSDENTPQLNLHVSALIKPAAVQEPVVVISEPDAVVPHENTQMADPMDMEIEPQPAEVVDLVTEREMAPVAAQLVPEPLISDEEPKPEPAIQQAEVVVVSETIATSISALEMLASEAIETRMDANFTAEQVDLVKVQDVSQIESQVVQVVSDRPAGFAEAEQVIEQDEKLGSLEKNQPAPTVLAQVCEPQMMEIQSTEVTHSGEAQPMEVSAPKSASTADKTSIDLDALENELFGDDDLEQALFSGDLSQPSSSDDVFADEVPQKKRQRNRKPGQRKPSQPPIAQFEIPSIPDKAYLEAGLYSIDYKLSEEERQKYRVQCTNLAHTEGRKYLPLPIEYGEYYMSQEHEFYIPYDILFSFQRTPKAFQKISRNIFVHRKKRYDDNPPQCMCKRPLDGSPGCLEDCINRLTFVECSPENCPCGEQCSNQAFQRGEGVKDIHVFYAGNRGFGLKTNVPIKKGQLVIEYTGEVISPEICMERAETVYAQDECVYYLDYHNGEILDGGLKGNEARFVNHSCDPNCHIEKWHVDGEICVGVFASRDIEKGSELTYDYNFHCFDEENPMACLCESAKCRGFVGKKSNDQKPDKSSDVSTTASASASRVKKHQQKPPNMNNAPVKRRKTTEGKKNSLIITLSSGASSKNPSPMPEDDTCIRVIRREPRVKVANRCIYLFKRPLPVFLSRSVRSHKPTVRELPKAKKSVDDVFQMLCANSL